MENQKMTAGMAAAGILICMGAGAAMYAGMRIVEGAINITKKVYANRKAKANT